ncbi:MAG TPA: hypothetical protein VGR95_23110 [Thermoanaerobaculia bacterium]|nr:hypothetical protein [Thermoanaerobaculia bacterium]
MKKYVVVIFTAALLLVASQAFALLFELTYEYYSDGTFTTWVGEQDYDYCNNAITSTGSTSDFRTKDRMNCDTGAGTHECQQLVNGTWVTITCPPGV